MENTINFTNSIPLNTFSGGSVWKQGFILRVIPKNENNVNDVVYPLPVFYDKITGKILTTTLPLEIADEYKNVNFYDVNVVSNNSYNNQQLTKEENISSQDPLIPPQQIIEENIPQNIEWDDPQPPSLEWEEEESEGINNNFWDE